MKVGDVSIEWLGHSGLLIKNSKVIYIDPFKIGEGDFEKADVVLLTHGHYDHCSVEDVGKVIRPGTHIFCTPDTQSKIARFDIPVKMTLVYPGDEFDLGSVKVSSVPAYNVDKDFHSKEEGLVGYVVKMHDVILYHAGDTDKIDEMQKLTGFNQAGRRFIAFLPVGGRYTMNAEEAFEAVKVIKPSVAVPIHWGEIVGSREDAEEFKSLCDEEGVECEIMNKRQVL